MPCFAIVYQKNREYCTNTVRVKPSVYIKIIIFGVPITPDFTYPGLIEIMLRHTKDKLVQKKTTKMQSIKKTSTGSSFESCTPRFFPTIVVVNIRVQY